MADTILRRHHHRLGARRLCHRHPRRRSLASRPPSSSAIILGGICLNWGCIPTKALLRSAEIYHYMQHAKDYGLSATNVGYDPPKPWCRRSRGVSKRLNDGVGFLMKKNKVTVIWGEAAIDAPGKITVKTIRRPRRPKGRSGTGQLSGQAHHHRHRRAAARAAGA